jgi:hypothetical protein
MSPAETSNHPSEGEVCVYSWWSSCLSDLTNKNLLLSGVRKTLEDTSPSLDTYPRLPRPIPCNIWRACLAQDWERVYRTRSRLPAYLRVCKAFLSVGRTLLPVLVLEFLITLVSRRTVGVSPAAPRQWIKSRFLLALRPSPG